MPIVKMSDLPEVVHNNGDGSEFGQIVQGDVSKKAVLLFSDITNKEFVIPKHFAIRAATESGNKNVVEFSQDGHHFYLGPKSSVGAKPDTDLNLSGVIINNVSVDVGQSYDGWSIDREQKPLIGMGIDDKVTVGNTTSSVALVQGTNRSVSVRKEATPGSGVWADHRLMDEGNIRDYIVLHMNSVYTYGMEEPNDDDGYPDGHLYLKY